MNRPQAGEELEEAWTLGPDEHALLSGKRGSTRLGFAILSRFFAHKGRFPYPEEVDAGAPAYVADQVGVSVEEYGSYDHNGRTAEYHRAQIRATFGFHPATAEDAEGLAEWLLAEVAPREYDAERLKEAARARLRALKVEPPRPGRMERLVRSALSRYDDRFCETTLGRLSESSLAGMDTLLLGADAAIMPGTLIGYARCSTDEQDLTAQRERLAELGVADDRIYLDHGLTGAKRARPGLDQALVAVADGDTLVVPKLDRLARSVPDARAIGDDLAERGIALSLGGQVYDPNDPMGKMFFNILATFAEFEVDLLRMRTREGMAVAKAKGKLRGKQPKLSPKQQAELQRMHNSGDYTITDLTELFSVSRPTVYRTLQRGEDGQAR